MEIEPIQYHLRKLMGQLKPSSIESICDKSWQVAPGGKDKFPLALFLSKHLSMKLKTVPGISLEYEVSRVKGMAVDNAPTKAYQLNEAKLLSGFVYKNEFRSKLSNNKESVFNSFGILKEENEGLLVSTWASNTYFGHWIHDECIRVIAAQDMGVSSYCTDQRPYSHQSGYEKIFNLSSLPVKRAIFKKLIILSDATLNNYRQKRLLQLRNLVFSSVVSNKNNYIYIKRGTSGASGRSLVNENLLIEQLTQFGFVIIEPEKLSAYEVMQECLNAKIIMGIEGSSLVHGFLGMHSEGTLVALVPEYQFNNPFQNYCSSIGLRYGFLVGKEVRGGFNIDLDDMSDLLMRVN